MYQYANGTKSPVPPFEAFAVFPEHTEKGYIYSKLALDGLIESYCGRYEMQVKAAKWRVFALLNNEYRSLAIKHNLALLNGRAYGEEWHNLQLRMEAIDKVIREYSEELLGAEI